MSSAKGGFLRDAAGLFLRLRAADLVNLVAGMYLVPKFIDRGELGAVLPIVGSATLCAMPAFAFAMVLMKESSRLAERRATGELKSLLRGALIGTALVMVIALGISCVFLPRFTRAMRVTDRLVPFMALVAAFAGSFAPVYQDALNGLGRFRVTGLAEILSAFARIGVMLLIMPFRAFLGFFAGNAAQPFVRMAVAVFALRRELRVDAAVYWTAPRVKRLALLFVGILAALVPPLLVSLVEQSLIRTACSVEDSALYYLETRLSDLLNYLTLPVMLVLFPYAARAAEKGASTHSLVLRSTLSALVGAALLGIIYWFSGDWFLSLLASGSIPSGATMQVELLLVINLLTAFQVFVTNTELAAGRFRFLIWFIPLHLAYVLFLLALDFVPSIDLIGLIWLFLGFAALRAVFSFAHLGSINCVHKKGLCKWILGDKPREVPTN